MPIVHVVEEGEHLGQIADRYGFLRIDTIWDAPENAELKKARKNANVLLPGDRVTIPDKKPRVEDGATGKKHRFVARPQKLRLRVRLLDAHDEPVKGAKCELTIDGETYPVTSDGDGYVEQPIPLGAKSGGLELGQERYELAIGGLDPVDSDTGLRGRLNNLGYDAGDPDAPDARQLDFAIELFQCDHDLTVDAKQRDAVQKKLETVHGS